MDREGAALALLATLADIGGSIQCRDAAPDDPTTLEGWKQRCHKLHRNLLIFGVLGNKSIGQEP